MTKNISVMFGLLILFQAVDIFFVEDFALDFGTKNFPAFNTVELNGEQVTEKIFDGKISVVIVWSVQNEKSLDLLKNLESESKNFPGNIQLIGLIGNTDAENFSRACDFAKNFSPTIKQLAVNDDFAPVLSKIKFVPTIIFVDEHRNFIGQPAGGDLKFILRELNFILEKNSERNQSLIKIQEIILNRN